MKFFSLLKDRTAVYILLAGTAVRILLSIFVPPGFDEAYYGVYAMHPSAGYFDHPPAVTFTAGFGIWLTGVYSAFTLRLGALILFIFSSFLIYNICRRLFGKRQALIGFTLFTTIPYFLAGMGVFVIPDNALGFFWLLFIYAAVSWQVKQKNNYLLLGGIAFGFAMLSKYHAVFLIGGLGLAMLLVKEWKVLFKNPYFYAAVLISFIIFSPNILWNYNHDWVSYAFQFGKGGGGDLSVTKFLQGIFVQAGYLLPWNMFILIAAFFYAFRSSDANIKMLLLVSALPVGIFTLLGATRQILPHWPMPGYLTAIIIAAGYLFNKKIALRKTIYITSTVLIVLAAAFLIVQSQSGMFSIPKKGDITLDGQGWDEVIEELKNQNMITNTTFLFTDKWYTGGELAFASEGRYKVTVLNENAAHQFAFWTDPKELLGKDGIFIGTDRFDSDPAGMYNSYFKDFIKLNDFITYRNGNEAQIFSIWRGKNMIKEFPFSYGN